MESFGHEGKKLQFSAVTVYIYTYASPLFLRPSLVPVAVTPDIRLAFGKS